MTLTNQPIFQVELRPLPRRDDPHGIRRLRAALKALLRRYGLCVVSVRPDVETEAEAK
jgi:hypothetical protein